ncbi:phospholipid carrier-dependent glycosyltransferase [Salinicoccus kekensis]|uniref:Dolichyl-phosphate-mannose-protein mannosyltransferase n=1 Tax=Salinicoccus kekensis TaxID=714307 RepID=A0A285U711_9STAP|nr:phospholipid carrier-dependent glycosyltransferase [Salinicoccus kekensis]SOC37705.1 dolichyl-phosphate-mannose-protein mannosyltransferase [Salinicoccus kekensis]
MIIIWLAASLYIIVSFLFQHYITDTYYMTFSFIIFTVIVLFFTLLINHTKFIAIIYTSFIIRLIMMLIDSRPGEKVIPHSGEDTENYYETALEISANPALVNSDIYGGFYSKFLGLLFHVYGDDRLFAQFLNIIIAVTAILIMIKIFKMLDISGRVQWFLVLLMAFFPHSLIFSSILMRESLISITIVLSLYFFTRWYKHRERSSALLSVVFVLLGASFHTAVMGILIGYLFGFIFYRHNTKEFKFSVESLVPFSIFAVITTYMLVFPNVVADLPIFNKVDQVFNEDVGLYETVASASGGSAYLTGLEVNNLFQLLLYSPIKFIYFIASPMPWNIGSLNELIAFLLDGVFYIVALAVFIKNYYIIKERPILAILLLSVMAGWFIFGLAISNAGTGLRHRFKFFYIIVVILGVIWDQRRKR